MPPKQQRLVRPRQQPSNKAWLTCPALRLPLKASNAKVAAAVDAEAVAAVNAKKARRNWKAQTRPKRAPMRQAKAMHLLKAARQVPKEKARTPAAAVAVVVAIAFVAIDAKAVKARLKAATMPTFRPTPLPTPSHKLRSRRQAPRKRHRPALLTKAMPA
mgnify:CR=1 FL=1